MFNILKWALIQISSKPSININMINVSLIDKYHHIMELFSDEIYDNQMLYFLIWRELKQKL